MALETQGMINIYIYVVSRAYLVVASYIASLLSALASK